jgi:hypothetical protein
VLLARKLYYVALCALSVSKKGHFFSRTQNYGMYNLIVSERTAATSFFWAASFCFWCVYLYIYIYTQTHTIVPHIHRGYVK